MPDIQYAIIFYLVFSLFGVFGYYLLQKVLPKTDKFLLYTVSKPLGLVIFAYPIWLASSFKLLKFNENLILLLLFIVFLTLFASLLTWDFFRKTHKKKIDLAETRKFWFSIGLIELGTIILYSTYLFIRAFKPDIEGTEKFMDLMMLASAGKTDYFPFFDAWWAGKDVNYYYYGFYLFALISNIGSVPYEFAYNMAMGIIFSQTFIVCFATIFRVTKNYLSAFFGSALVNLAGNLHYTTCLVQNFDSNTINSKCFYPKASRILDPAFTINEFPTYSYILGDLHPHVLSLPLFALGLYLIVEIFKEKRFNPFLHIVFGFVIASAGIVNFWDFMTLGGIYGIIFIFKILKYISNNFFSDKNSTKKVSEKIYSILTKTGIAILLAVSPFLIYLPFFLHFQSPVAGLGFAPEFVAYHQRTYPDMQWPSSPWFQFGMWGFFLILIIPSLLVFLIFNWNKIKKLYIVILFFFSAFLLVLFTELFFFRDLFHIANPPYFRANTVFKFTYHAWILLGITTAISLHLGWNAIGQIKDKVLGLASDIFSLLAISVVMTASLIYSHFGFSQAYGLEYRLNATINKLINKNYISMTSNSFPAELSLDGSKWIKNRDKDDYEVIKWINKNQKERVVILESTGSAYTYFGRIGVFTGMGNIIQWETHQWTWRFKYPQDAKGWKDVTERKLDTGYSAISITNNEVRTAYETDNAGIAYSILSKYKVKYIYIGSQERTAYTKLNEAKFEEIAELVFQSGNSKLYRINN